MSGLTYAVGRDGDDALEAALLAFVAEQVAPAHGVTVRVVAQDGSPLLNAALQAGELDGHVAQHWPYLRRVKDRHGWRVRPAVPLYVSTVAVASRRHRSLDALPAGARVAIPDDPANLAHVLGLLAARGVAALDPGTPAEEATLADLVEPASWRLEPTPVAQVARLIDAADAVIVTRGRLREAGVEAGEEIAALGAEPAYAKQLMVREDDDPERLAPLLAVFEDRRVADFVSRELGSLARPLPAA